VFERILIANRGEIACRVARTARRLGISTVAVYSDADAHALHVRECDVAVRIGPAPARESYLDGEAILEAARRTGAQAVHPGYGFLSENAEFAEACAAAGLVFIGPPPEAIRAMGSKSAAKALMAAAGVPLVPGYHGVSQDIALLKAEAARIGYPVLIKASAGGGGKGMRIVEQPDDFEERLASCRREALASFGDDRVLIERYLERPRHVEIQVFADRHGHCVHLFERDCSSQRRHQKVIEEAPAPHMTPERRRRMGAAAVAAARAVGYVGAGTVEFIVPHAAAAGAADAQDFFFMEMNTRLQVEHPVTEMITGLDLVEWQLRVAAGETLPLAEDQLHIRGHAIEARIYAEDPSTGFLPSIGTLHHLAMPAPGPHVRIDTGVAQGDAITPYYDPMIAKLVAWDVSREQAIERLREALAAFRIVGVENNVEFLHRLASSQVFRDGRVDTGYIEREGLALTAPSPVPQAAWHAAASVASLAHSALPPEPARARPRTAWDSVGGWRLNGRGSRLVTLRAANEERIVRVEYGADDAAPAASVDVVRRDGTCHVFLGAQRFVLQLVDPLADARPADADDAGVASPMPGKVAAILVKEGDTVAKGAPLMVLEAMKMEYTVRAPESGTVKAFRYALGEQVPAGAPLLDFECAVT
jgi:3-methylcrotonyl-CoA carboxylase alpha subunit